MAGIVTDVRRMLSAISAVAEGYDVYAVIDSSATWDKTIQEAAMHPMTRGGVKVCTWTSVVAEIMNDGRIQVQKGECGDSFKACGHCQTNK